MPKKLTKDIARFGLGSIVLGGSAMKALPKQIRPSKKAKRIFG